MARRLKAYVHVHQDDGSVNVYGPEDEVPDKDAKKIGDHAWTEDELEPEQGPRISVDAERPAKKAAAKKAPVKAAPRSTAKRAPAGAAKATPATPARPAEGGLKPGDSVEGSEGDE